MIEQPLDRVVAKTEEHQRQLQRQLDQNLQQHPKQQADD
jgi:hypothetical protein